MRPTTSPPATSRVPAGGPAGLRALQEVSWTLRSYEDYKAAKEDGCLCIFENFLPLETCAQKKFTFADLLAQAKTAAVCGIHRVEEPGKSTAAK